MELAKQTKDFVEGIESGRIKIEGIESGRITI
jgi:hypothetical protein